MILSVLLNGGSRYVQVHLHYNRDLNLDRLVAERRIQDFGSDSTQVRDIPTYRCGEQDPQQRV